MVRVPRALRYAAFTLVLLSCAAIEPGLADAQPSPLVAKGTPVDWFFVYKFNTKSFPQCADNADRSCPFGGRPVEYRSGFGQQYVVASSADPQLKAGGGCLGDTDVDPVGATFDEIYNGSLNFVVWNDQFYNDPKIKGCGTSCASPWAHSKGVLAWDDNGNGVVMQVTTPSWPGAGNKDQPRTDGNSLGCVANDNNVLVAQSFFAARLTTDDTEVIVKALANASVVTNTANPQIVRNGGPNAIKSVVASLGNKSNSDEMLWNELSTGIQVMAKPSEMHAPPWHLVSSLLGSVDLQVATWWTANNIPDTTAGQKIDCWPDQTGWKRPGAVVNSTMGHWDLKSFSLLGTGSSSGNHAKIGVSTSGNHPYAIFGDMNQQGELSGSCGASQNGRGGLFFVVENQVLHDGVLSLISNRQPMSSRR
jgi:hypothetical protein